MESTRGPAYSNWVVKGHLLIGPHPGSVSTRDMVANLTKLLEAGVTTFVCLQHEMPSLHITGKPTGASRVRSAFDGVVVHAKPYIEDAQIIAEHARMPQASRDRPITFLHLPIPDSNGATVPDSVLSEFVLELLGHLKAGELLYVQCGDGNGRSGTVAAILLGLLYDLSSSEALDLAQRSRTHRAGTQGLCPDTHEQKMQVHRLLGNASFRRLATETPAKPSYEKARNPEEDVSAILKVLRSQLSARGTSSFMDLRSHLASVGGPGAPMSLYEFVRALASFGLRVNDDEAQVLLGRYPSGSSSGAPGGIDTAAFLRALRGSLDDFRLGIVQQAFCTLPINERGETSVDAVARVYSGAGHPDVRAGRQTEKEVVSAFLASFMSRASSRGTITQADFEEYYADVSAAVEDDNYFQLMMWNAWPLKSRTVAADAAGISTLASADRARAAAGHEARSTTSAYKAPEDPAVLLARLRTAVLKTGETALPRFRLALRAQDGDRDGWLSCPEFVAAVKAFGVPMTDIEIQDTFEVCHPDRGHMQWDPLVDHFAGQLSPFRRRLVLSAFERLDASRRGSVNVDHVHASFNAEKHPAVVASRRNARDVYLDFAETFVEGLQGSEVTLPHFERYYTAVSAAIEDDDEFQMIMWNTWSLGAKATPGRAIATPETSIARRNDGDDGLFGAMDRLNAAARRAPSASVKPTNRALFQGHAAQYTSADVLAATGRGASGSSAASVTSGLGRRGVEPPPVPGVDQELHIGLDRGKKRSTAAHDRVYGGEAADTGAPFARDDDSVARLRAEFARVSTGSVAGTSYSHSGTRGQGGGGGSGSGSGYPGARAPANPAEIHAMVREDCAKRGPRGFLNLQARLLNASRGAASVPTGVFAECLTAYGVPLTREDMSTLCSAHDNGGYVNIPAFFSAVRGRLPSHREDLIRSAFANLDVTGSGRLPLDTLRMKYNAASHPDVASGKRSEAEVLREFLETCDIGRDGIVTVDEFVDYFASVSAGIPDDNFFRMLMWNTWNMSASSSAPVALGPRTPGGPFSPPASRVAAGVSTTGRMEYHLAGSGMSSARTAESYGLPPPPVSTPGTVPVPVVMDRLRATFARRGITGLLELSRSFRIMDKDRTGTISLEELARCLQLYGLGLSEPELKAVFQVYDRDGNGRISFEEFVRGFRGAMPPQRTELVRRAFQKLDVDGSGSVDVSDIAMCFNPRENPDVKSGKKTERDALRDFLECFDSIERDGRVTFEEFCEYYANISATIDDDSYFQLLMWNTWQLDKPHPARAAASRDRRVRY